jgi:hypothetical protein
MEVSSSSIYCQGRPDFSWIPSKFRLPATASNRVEGRTINFAAATAVFPALANSITFNLVVTALYIPSISVTGIGGSGLPCVVEAVEVISTVLFTVSVVTTVTLVGSVVGFDVKAGTLFSGPRRLGTLFVVVYSCSHWIEGKLIRPFLYFDYFLPWEVNCVSPEYVSFRSFLASAKSS